MSGIYYIKNKINNKVYVGMSINLKKRFNRHLNLLKRNSHFNANLQEDFNIYGIDSFEFGILEEVDSRLAEDREEFYISYFKSKNICYNIRLNNYMIATETINKIKINTKIAMSKESVKNKLKKTLSDETKAKISKTLKETYANNPQLSARLSVMSKNRKRRCLSEEEKEKLRGSNNGNSKTSEEDVLNIRIRKNNGEQKKTVYMDYKDKISERNFKAIWLYQTWKHIIP